MIYSFYFFKKWEGGWNVFVLETPVHFFFCVVSPLFILRAPYFSYGRRVLLLAPIIRLPGSTSDDDKSRRLFFQLLIEPNLKNIYLRFFKNRHVRILLWCKWDNTFGHLIYKWGRQQMRPMRVFAAGCWASRGTATFCQSLFCVCVFDATVLTLARHLKLSP